MRLRVFVIVLRMPWKTLHNTVGAKSCSTTTTTSGRWLKKRRSRLPTALRTIKRPTSLPNMLISLPFSDIGLHYWDYQEEYNDHHSKKQVSSIQDTMNFSFDLLHLGQLYYYNGRYYEDSFDIDWRRLPRSSLRLFA